MSTNTNKKSQMKAVYTITAIDGERTPGPSSAGS